MKKILIVGASGSVGYHALQTAKAKGFWVRTLSRNRWHAPKVSIFADDLWLRDATNPQTIRGLCQGVDVVLSCMGASIESDGTDKRSHWKMDLEANRNVLREALAAKVPRFVYVSVVGCGNTENTAYVGAHRRFERSLRESGIDFTIIRLTSLFSTFDSMIERAKSGSLPVIGQGDSKTNPIHPEDAAEVCIRNLFRGPDVVEAGGPEVFTRREICDLCFRHVGREPSLYRVPAFLLQITGGLTRPFNARRASLLQFLPAASSGDALAPPLGTRRFADYLLGNARPEVCVREEVAEIPETNTLPREIPKIA